MKRRIYNSAVVLFALMIMGQAQAQVKILFDATKGEMAGNADWVIDADQINLRVGASGAYTVATTGTQSNAQQIPTPPQSGITSTTPETYWKGGISSWAVDLVKKGYTVETLPWNGQITYGNTANAQDLSNYKVFVVDEPNIVFSTAEKTALMQFVQNGGGLFMVADHDVSDRNGDGWDSPHIWNNFFTTNSVAANPFGITFDYADLSGTSTGISTSTTDSLVRGAMGNVAKVYWAGGTTMTLNPSNNATVKGSVFRTGVTSGNNNVYVASALYGRGRVAAMGDSSPTDDSTGNNGNCTLYNGYWTDAAGNHRTLLINTTIWLANANTSKIAANTSDDNTNISIAPNPSTGNTIFITRQPLYNTTLTVLNIIGKVMQIGTYEKINQSIELPAITTPGIYFLKVENENIKKTLRFVVH